MRTLQVKCDGCDKRVDIESREAVPTNWKTVRVDDRAYDLCASCFPHWNSVAHPINWPRKKPGDREE